MNNMAFKVYFKLIWRKFFSIPSFCKCCGREVHDFIVPDEVWNRISPLIKRGNVVCYDCFCDLCKDVGLPTVWYLQRKEIRK